MYNHHTRSKALLVAACAALAVSAAGCAGTAAELESARTSIENLHEQGRTAAQDIVNEMAEATQGPTLESSAQPPEDGQPTGPGVTLDGFTTQQTTRYAGLEHAPVADISALSGPFDLTAVGPDWLAFAGLPGADSGLMVSGLAGGPEDCAIPAWADMTAVTGNRPVWVEQLLDGQIHFWTSDPVTGAPDALVAAEMIGIGNTRLPAPGSPAAGGPNKYLPYLIGVQDKAMARADSCLWSQQW